jgi:hypothetical protein
MSDLRKHFRKLMEDVDMNYQPPVHPNSGGGLTKFSPTPASKVLKNYSVDHDFLHKALSYGNPNMQAVDQIMGAIGGTATNGVLGGQHFDDIIGSFNSPEVLGNQLPPAPEAMPPVEPVEPQGEMIPDAGAEIPPVDPMAPIDVSADHDGVDVPEDHPDLNDIDDGETEAEKEHETEEPTNEPSEPPFHQM